MVLNVQLEVIVQKDLQLPQLLNVQLEPSVSLQEVRPSRTVKSVRKVPLVAKQVH